MQGSHAGVQEGGEQSWLSGGRGSFRQTLLRATLAWLEAWLPCCLCCCSTPARLRCGTFDMYVVCGGWVVAVQENQRPYLEQQSGEYDLQIILSR